jgi:RNA polymerase sigma factor
MEQIDQNLLARAKSGDEQAGNQLLEQMTPLVRKAVRRFLRTFRVDDSDEFSIALMAANEAVYRYRNGTLMSFENYAALVIRNRLIDWQRQQKSQPQTVSYDADLSENGGTGLANKLTDHKGEQVQQNLEFEQSYMEIEWLLQQYGLSFESLTDSFPKHRDSRLMCINLARLILADNSLLLQFNRKRQLPGKGLSKLSGIPVKTIEKNRGSIILLTLIMQSDLQQLQYYIKAYERGT